jgi:hypothetical protein
MSSETLLKGSLSSTFYFFALTFSLGGGDFFDWTFYLSSNDDSEDEEEMEGSSLDSSSILLDLSCLPFWSLFLTVFFFTSYDELLQPLELADSSLSDSCYFLFCSDFFFKLFFSYFEEFSLALDSVLETDLDAVLDAVFTTFSDTNFSVLTSLF